MTLIRPLGYISVWPLCHTLYARQAKLGKAEDGVRRLLVEPDTLRDWKTLANMISKCERILMEQAPGIGLTETVLEMLDPGATLPWEYGVDGQIQAHIGIVTNPMARIYAGPESWSVGWGEVLLSMPGSRTKHASVNFGESPRVHLILTLRIKVIENANS